MNNKANIIVKTCGIPKIELIDLYIGMGANWIGLDFNPESPSYIKQISSGAGIIPDYKDMSIAKGIEDTEDIKATKQKVLLCGTFTDGMPQNIVTRVYNYKLDIVQLDGEEKPIMIDNLKRTLIPDIAKDIKIMKTVYIADKQDFNLCNQYEGVVDYFLFKISDKHIQDEALLNLINAYEGNTPFMLEKCFSKQDASILKAIQNTNFMGINLNLNLDCYNSNSDTEINAALIDILS